MQNVISTPIPKNSQGALSLRTVRNAVVRHPLIFTGLLFFSATVAGGVWFFSPLPKNTGVIVFQLSGQAPRVISASSENQIDLRTYGSLQAATLRRRQVLSNALNHPEMKKATILEREPDKIAWLDKNLQIDFKGGLEFMRVAIEGDQPEELIAILRAVSSAFMAAVDQRDNGDRKKRLVLIEESILQQQSEIAVKSKRLDVIAQSLKTTDGPTLAIIESLNQDELRSARRELLDAQQKVETLRTELPQPGEDRAAVELPAAIVDDALRREPALLQAEAKVAATKLNLRDTEARFEAGSINATIAKAKQDVRSAEESRDKLRTELRAQVEKTLKEQISVDIKLKALRHKEAFDQADNRRKSSDKLLQEIVTRINKHGEYRVELDKLRKEVSSTERVLATLTDERDRIRIEERAPSRVSLPPGEEPYVLSGVEGNRRLKTVLMSSIGVFLAGFVALVFSEHRGRRVTSAEELRKTVGIDVLGSIPVTKPDEPRANRLVVESVDALRTQLLQARKQDRPLRTILVASGLSREGKTTLSGHLSVSLARAGYRVLMVDGDLHAPTAHRLFDLPVTPGLCEVLRAEAVVAEAVHATPVPGLSILPAGSWDMATRQCLVGDRWGLVRDQLQHDFDFVIVDTAPLLLMADTLLLAKGCDGVLVSVLLGFSRLGVVGLTQERLQSMDVRVLGAVINGAAAEFASDYYGRYKYSADAVSRDLVPIPLTVA